VNALFDRRQTERFAQLLDEASGGRRHHSRTRLDDRLADHVHLADQLRNTYVPGPSADFRSGLRAQLMAKAERDGIGATATEPEEPVFARPARSRTRIAIVAGIATGAVAVSGISMASGDANPGDALYQVKRSTEKAQLALASSDLSRGQLYLEFARTLLAEANAVHKNPAGFNAALADMDSNTVDGVRLLTATATTHKDPAALDRLDSFVTEQKRLIGQLTGLVDLPSRQRIDASVTLLDAIGARSRALRTALACGAGTAGKGTDDLGPIAALCAPAAAVGSGATTTPGTTEQQGGTGSVKGGGTPAGASKPATAPSTNTSPAATAPSASPTPAPTASEDGGILGQLGRILGGLLGD